MSLVGTRPILQDELLKYELHHRARIAIKPGITGMWQVSGRSDITDFEEVVRLDTEYISKYCYVNVRHLPRFFDYSTELTYSKSERVSNVDDIQHPAIRNAMKMLDMHEIRLTYEADLPARSGLGTSSSFAVGMLNAFYALKGKYADKKKLADGCGCLLPASS